MGKVEKIVVLSVVFLIVVILVVSTQTGGGDPTLASYGGVDAGEAAARSERPLSEPLSPPGTSADAELAPAGRDGAPIAGAPIAGADPAPASPSARPGGAVDGPGATVPEERRTQPEGESGRLLLTEVFPSRPVYEVPEEIPEDWDLGTLAGLADHLFDPGLKVYTAKAGDTLAGLAKRYYGDASFVAALERNNEGVERLTEGLQVLLPVHARAVVDEPDDTYVVQDGESLWKIAKKVYGAGHRWGEIYDANRDVLASPEALRTGIRLRIP